MKHHLALLTTIFLGAAFCACKHERITVIPPRTDIHLDSNAQVGSHLVDKDGNSLYYFSNDVAGQSNCTGGCLTAWPIFLADSATTTYSGELAVADFKTIVTAAGNKQTTYKGWPLYYYAPAGVREAAKLTTGEAVGNVWYVAKTNYSIMIANYQLTGANGTNYLSNYTPGTGRTSYFCDEKGNTLYGFGRDSAFKNKYTTATFSNNSVWPIYETENIMVPSTLDKTLFTVITVFGKKQLTYKGWPLYYYGPDNYVRGINKGITVPASQPVGAIWPIIFKDIVQAPRL